MSYAIMSVLMGKDIPKGYLERIYLCPQKF